MDDELRQGSKVSDLEPEAFVVLDRYRVSLKAVIGTAQSARNVVRTALRIEQDAHRKGTTTRNAGEVIHWARVASGARSVAVAGKAVLDGTVDNAEQLIDERWVEFWLEAGKARQRKIAAMATEFSHRLGRSKGGP